MKKINFLNKLLKEKKIEIVEPSEEIKKSCLKKSESSLESAKILLENDKFEESIALSYYSMYHMITALLFKAGIKCENHLASIILLKELFNINNADILSAKTERIDKQYYVDFNITVREVMASIKMAESFNNNLLDFISRLNNDKIKYYRERLNTLM